VTPHSILKGVYGNCRMWTSLNKEVYLLKIEVSFLKELVGGGRTFDLAGSG